MSNRLTDVLCSEFFFFISIFMFIILNAYDYQIPSGTLLVRLDIVTKINPSNREFKIVECENKLRSGQELFHVVEEMNKLPQNI